MKLFIEDDYLALPNPAARQFLPFRVLIDRDTSKDKVKSRQEFSWIYHTYDLESPFIREIPDDEVFRAEEVKKAIFGEEDWTPDDQVKEAAILYRRLTETEGAQLLKAAWSVVARYRSHLASVDFTILNDRTNMPVYDPQKVMKSLLEIEKVMDTLEKVKEKINKMNIDRGGNIRGSAQLSEWNR